MSKKSAQDSILYQYVVPTLWNYFQSSVINIGSASLGAVCYELKERNVKEVTNMLLLDKAQALWKCKEFPVSLLVELPLLSNINKITIASEKYAPQVIKVEYSTSGKNQEFQTLATIFDLHKGNPHSIEKAIKAKFIRVKILKGRLKRNQQTQQLEDGSCTLSQIQMFGSPSLSPENIQYISVSKLMKLASQVKKAMSDELQNKNEPKPKFEHPEEPTSHKPTPAAAKTLRSKL